MPISFDPDWQATTEGTGTTVTPALPAGSDGDTLIMFSLSVADVWDVSAGWDWGDAAGWTMGSTTRNLYSFYKVRGPGESAPTIEYVADTPHAVIIGNFPGSGYTALSNHDLTGVTDGDETVSTGPVGVALAGVVVSAGSNALAVTHPDSNYSDYQELLSDAAETTITDRFEAIAWEPGDPTPDFTFTTVDSGALRWALFLGRPVPAGRWRTGRVGWPA